MIFPGSPNPCTAPQSTEEIDAGY